MIRKIILLLLSAFLTSFLPTVVLAQSAQSPATESTIVIESDGIAPFDATTSTPAGTDASSNNGVVRNFD